MSESRPGTGRDQIRAELRASWSRCFRCTQPLDWTRTYRDDTGRVDPWYPTLDHKKSWVHHPHLRNDPSNRAASHALCNQRAGAVDTRPGLGEYVMPR